MTGVTADQTARSRPPELSMSGLSDDELYVRGCETWLAAWEQYAAARRRDVATAWRALRRQ